MALSLLPLPNPSGTDKNLLTAWINFKRIQSLFGGGGAVTLTGLNLTGLTASRLIASDASKNLVSVANLATWVLAGSGITVANNGDGTITVAQGAGAVTGSGAAGRVTYWSGASTLISTADFLFTDTTGAGVATELGVINPNNSNPTSHAILRLKAGGSLGGDPKIVFDKGGVGFRSFGMDMSDAQKLKFTSNESLGSNSTIFTLDFDNERIGVGNPATSPGYTLDIRSTGNIRADVRIYNDAATGGNGAVLRLETATTGQTPFIQFGNTTEWCFGLFGTELRLVQGSTSLSGGTLLWSTTSSLYDIKIASKVSNTTDATTTATGCLVLLGGLGIAKALWVGGLANIAGVLTVNNDLKLGTAGNGLYIKQGTNATAGVATLVGGTITINTTKVTANTGIKLSIQSLGTVAAPKAIGVTARTAGTSFTITSADATDTSVIYWEFTEPA